MDYENFLGIKTYHNPLIYFKIENFHNWKHREIMYRKEPNVKTYLTKLDEEIFQEIPQTKPAMPDVVRQDWQKEDWSNLCVKMFDMARLHRWCIVALYEEPPYWRVFGPRETISMQYENDIPISADIRWWRRLPRNAGGASFYQQTIDFDADSALFVRFGKPIGDYIGESDVEHIWSLLVELLYMKEDIVRNSAKSSGFYFIKTGSQATADDASDMEDALSKANYGNALAASENKIIEIDDVHPKNAEFSIKAYDKVMKKLAGACRLPLSFFNSETEKAGIGKENKSSEEMLINKKKRYIFGCFKTDLLRLIEMRWGIQVDDIYPTIEETEEEEYRDEIIHQNQAKPEQEEENDRRE